MGRKLLVTGDVHFPIDRRKLTVLESMGYSKGDTLLVCGDFGGVWYDRDTVQQKNRERVISEYPFDIVWCDGNHENFDSLETYPLAEKFGDKVHQITNNCFHLLRGGVYNICGKSIFAFGGAESTDKAHRIEGESWWSQEVPTFEELEAAEETVAKLKQADYVITHDAPARLLPILHREHGNILAYNEAFDRWVDKLEFKIWFFGHHHANEAFETNGWRLSLAEVPVVARANKLLVGLYNTVFDITETPKMIISADYFSSYGDAHIIWK